MHTAIIVAIRSAPSLRVECADRFSSDGITLADPQGGGLWMTQRYGRMVVVLVGVAVLATACGRLHFGGADKAREMEAAMRALLKAADKPTFVTRDAEGTRLWKQTQQFYQRRQFAPAWIEKAAPRPQMDTLVEAIGAAGSEGLDPELYSAGLLRQRHAEASKGFLTQKGFDPPEAGTLDVWLTYLYMKYASDLADGLSDLARADPTWQIKPEKFDPLAELEAALAGNKVAQSLQALTPEAPEYRALRKILADYRGIAEKGGWPAVPRSLKLKPGQKSAAVPALATRLAASGDYKGGVPAAGRPAAYVREMQDAVKQFQRRHGLTDDGVVGATVTAALNVPIERRIRQIELNMERWRWLPRDLGDRYVFVNIPDMRLDVWDHGRAPLSMRVVVGKKDTPTPIFNDEMTYVVFSPYWNVPPDIANNETLPAMLTDPGFLARTNMEVVDTSGSPVDAESLDLSDPTKYRFRQRPGADNSLGLVKFMFPNQYNVYLHDTPADSLFARASRSFSHGCVRVEQPGKLADYVLGDQADWTPERIAGAMHAGEEQTVKLKQPLPVYITYLTARVSADGFVQFRSDVYGIDTAQTARLADRLARLRRTAKG
jgi:L,D-transpeptidase YcbB